jgi:hypothetical protein
MDGKHSKLLDFLVTLMATNRISNGGEGGPVHQNSAVPRIELVAIRVCNYILQVYITGEISAVR